MNALYAEVHCWAATPFAWGETDCILALANWIHRVRGVDLGAPWRMAYSNAAECQQVTGFFTDPVAFMDKAVAPLGLERTEAPVGGDIGVCSLPWMRRPVGGLNVGRCRWAFKTQDGVTVQDGKLVTVIAAWSVGYEA